MLLGQPARQQVPGKNSFAGTEKWLIGCGEFATASHAKNPQKTSKGGEEKGEMGKHRTAGLVIAGVTVRIGVLKVR